MLSPHSAAKYRIAPITGLDGYSRFVLREMHKYIETDHALIVQYDGFVLNGSAWSDDFLKFDYIGAPFNPSGVVGNGGFSLRSKKLMQWIAQQPWDDLHPEDSCICMRHRSEIEGAGFNIAPLEVAKRFAIEGRSWNAKEWQGTPNSWNGEFGFHSLLTPLPPDKKPFKIFHHSLDQGDLIYGLAVMKALGGGALFISPDNKFPYPLASRWQRMGGDAETVDNLRPLLEAQDCVIAARYTHGTPFSTDYDLNRFRIPWQRRTAKDFDSILKLHCDAFGLPLPTSAWLKVNNPTVVEGRPIVVNRTARYQDLNWDWPGLIRKHHKQMFFVGTLQEYELFRGFCPECDFPYQPTKDCLELARYIAGAKILFGNQSLCMAIAHGLGKPVLCETWPQNPNVVINRPNAFYKIPAGWT